MAVVAIVGGYLLGSIPSAYIAGRIAKGIDIRDFGDGNVGATNARHVLGRGVGVLVLMADVSKGAAAILLAGEATAKPSPGSTLSDPSSRPD